MSVHTVELVLTPIDNRRLANLCGQNDQNLRHIERNLGVEIMNRGHAFQIIGARAAVEHASALLASLYSETGDQTMLSPTRIHLSLAEEQDKAIHPEASGANEKAESKISLKRASVKPRTQAQRQYIENIEAHDITFGIGPAGTGKTYLAVAAAAKALEEERVARIVLVRPAVEAGEKLGFLPGDLNQKVDPYLRPLYDALYEMLGFERVAKCQERNIIEVAPLAYMRGRTLNDAFVILDESQNTTVEQMKMFLTRIGFGSKVVITGDITQIDLPREKQSGLRHVISVLKDIPEISFNFFQAADAVRHPLIQTIVTAYDKHDVSL